MQMCQTHWNKLREAINGAGMEHLVASDGKACIENLKDELKEKKKTKGNFDPLMSANLAIMNNALAGGGFYLMTGAYCPLCEFQKYGGFPKEWIDNATRDALKTARRMELVPDVQ